MEALKLDFSCTFIRTNSCLLACHLARLWII